MDSMENAKKYATKANVSWDNDFEGWGAAQALSSISQAHAAIAQAEQLKRIADALEHSNELLARESELFKTITESIE